MKKRMFLIGLAVLMSAVAVIADEIRALQINFTDGSSEQFVTADIDSLWFSSDNVYMYVSYKSNLNTYESAKVSGWTFSMIERPVSPSIVWNGNNVTITNPLSSAGVTITADGADVSIVSTLESEVEYTLSGSSSDGSLHIVSTKKFQLTLNGLSLTCSDGPAINSQSGKKGTVLLQAGTTNTLTDGKSYASSTEDRKGTLFSEGQLIFTGSGTLNVYGNSKHAICSDDYIAVRSGIINVLYAKKDAIHANDSVLVSGGTLTLKPSSDGIDCDGPVYISGGTLDITTTGDAAKGVKSGNDVYVSGGSINITQSGNKEIADGDVSYCMGLKADTLMSITGGTIVINSSAEGAKGIKGTQDVLINGGNITVNLTGSGGTYSMSEVLATGTGSGSTSTSYIVYFYPYANSGMGGGMGGGGSRAWTDVKLYKSDGTLVATLSTTSVSDNTAYYYNFGSAVGGEYYFTGSYQSGGGMGGGTTYSCVTGTFSAPTGTALYYRPGSYTTSGNTRTYTLETWTPSSSGTGSSDTETFTTCGIKSDGTIQLLGGTITLNSTGSKGTCGVKTDGELIIGTSADSGPALTVKTTGTYVTTGSSSGWGGGGPGGGGSSYSGDPKAIKTEGAITMYGGDVVLTTTGTAGETLESKTSIDLKGGYLYASSQMDDAINSSGPISCSGAYVYAFSANNDAIDSNYGRTGAIVISGGVALAISAAGSPEEGFDCDNNSYITVTGGCALSAGGSQGGGGGWGGSSGGIGSSTQGYVLSTSSWSMQAKKYYAVMDASGNCLFAFLSPDSSVSSSFSLITATDMKSGSTYYVKYSGDAPANASVNKSDRIFVGGTMSNSTQALSFTATK